jgi:hypothetical protein
VHNRQSLGITPGYLWTGKRSCFWHLRRCSAVCRNLASQRGEPESKETSTAGSDGKPTGSGGNSKRVVGRIGPVVLRSDEVVWPRSNRPVIFGSQMAGRPDRGELVDPRIRRALRSPDRGSWSVFGSAERHGHPIAQAGRSSDRQSGAITRLGKQVDLRVGCARSRRLGTASDSRIGRTARPTGRIGAAGSFGGRQSGFGRSSDKPMGLSDPVGGTTKTWGPVISYMTGPHTYVCPYPAVASQPVAVTTRPAADQLTIRALCSSGQLGLEWSARGDHTLRE